MLTKSGGRAKSLTIKTSDYNYKAFVKWAREAFAPCILSDQFFYHLFVAEKTRYPDKDTVIDKQEDIYLPNDQDYQRLGLRRGASQEEIKKAFRQLALALHPDKNNDNTTEKYQQVRTSYEKLLQ